MYKELFRWVVAIIYQPKQAWPKLAEKNESGDTYLTHFVYPLIGLITAAAFVGVFFTQKEFSTEYALRLSIKALVSYFGGFHLSAYLLNEIWGGYFKREKDLKLCQRFVGYSSALMYVLAIFMALLPVSEFFFLRIFIFYTVYLVWEGAVPYMKVARLERMKFVITSSILIMFLPEVIGWTLSLLMPGMRV